MLPIGGYLGVNGALRNPTDPTSGYTVEIALVDANSTHLDRVKAVPGPPVGVQAASTWAVTASGAPLSGVGCRIASVYRSTA